MAPPVHREQRLLRNSPTSYRQWPASQIRSSPEMPASRGIPMRGPGKPSDMHGRRARRSLRTSRWSHGHSRRKDAPGGPVTRVDTGRSLWTTQRRYDGPTDVLVSRRMIRQSRRQRSSSSALESARTDPVVQSRNRMAARGNQDAARRGKARVWRYCWDCR